MRKINIFLSQFKYSKKMRNLTQQIAEKNNLTVEQARNIVLTVISKTDAYTDFGLVPSDFYEASKKVTGYETIPNSYSSQQAKIMVDAVQLSTTRKLLIPENITRLLYDIITILIPLLKGFLGNLIFKKLLKKWDKNILVEQLEILRDDILPNHLK